MILKLDSHFIIEHMDELIKLEDYVPFPFIEFDKQNERDDFLKSKNLLQDIREMDQLVRQKCEYYGDTDKAVNSVLIEWLDCHPEFEGIIAAESVMDYQNMKQNNDFGFVDLLYDVELPSEKEGVDWSRFDYDYNKISIKDDYGIKYPDFEKKSKIFDDYGSTLLACFLSYLV